MCLRISATGYFVTFLKFPFKNKRKIRKKILETEFAKTYFCHITWK